MIKVNGGGGIYGKAINAPDDIKDIEYDYIIIISYSVYEIKEQLINMGVEEYKIITKYVEYKITARTNFIKNFSQKVYKDKIQGSVGEAGVFRGDFSKVINKYFPDRKCYLFDTFEGFDEKDIKYERERGYSQAEPGHLSITSEEIVMEKMQFKDKVIIKKGYFPDTAHDISDQFCFINLDLDLYKPTIEGLNLFYDKMVKGGVILIHDYFSKGYEGVNSAVDEFLNMNGNNIITLPIGDDTSIAVVKF